MLPIAGTRRFAALDQLGSAQWPARRDVPARLVFLLFDRRPMGTQH
jgi:hypothetical protein